MKNCLKSHVAAQLLYHFMRKQFTNAALVSALRRVCVGGGLCLRESYDYLIMKDARIGVDGR